MIVHSVIRQTHAHVIEARNFLNTLEFSILLYILNAV
jgi:hypothetical protein